MSEPTSVKNIFETNPMGGMAGVLPYLGNSGMGGALGGGLGAGVLGGVLGGLLFNRNGLNGGGEGFVTPAQLTAGLNGVEENNNTTTILQTLGDIKASVPLAEAQVQLALAGVQNGLTSEINASQIANLQGQANINKSISDAVAATLASQSSIKETVQNGNSQINLGIANLATSGLQNTYALSQTITNDGEKTRALIQSINDANLQRQLAVAENALIEQRAIGRSREVEVNVTQTVTQNQAQLQAQAQTQQQFQILAQLAANINNLAGDIQAVRQTQSNVNFGVQGNAAQTASAANNRVN